QPRFSLEHEIVVRDHEGVVGGRDQVLAIHESNLSVLVLLDPDEPEPARRGVLGVIRRRTRHDLEVRRALSFFFRGGVKTLNQRGLQRVPSRAPPEGTISPNQLFDENQVSYLLESRIPWRLSDTKCRFVRLRTRASPNFRANQIPRS